MNIRYLLGVLITVPLLPLMFYQGKKVKGSIPKLPEASGTSGVNVASIQSNKVIKMISMGESTIAGVGVDTHSNGFTGTLAAELSILLGTTIHWEVYARSGYTAAQVAKIIIPESTDEHIDLIVIGLGGNDAFTLNRPKRWRKDIAQLIQDLKIKYPEAFIFFCNMPPIKEFPAFTTLMKFTLGNLVEILGEELEDLVKSYQKVYYFGEVIKVQDWVDLLHIDEGKSAFFSDGVHPSKLTYQTWAKDIAFRIAHTDLAFTNPNLK